MSICWKTFSTPEVDGSGTLLLPSLVVAVVMIRLFGGILSWHQQKTKERQRLLSEACRKRAGLAAIGRHQKSEEDRSEREQAEEKKKARRTEKKDDGPVVAAFMLRKRHQPKRDLPPVLRDTSLTELSSKSNAAKKSLSSSRSSSRRAAPKKHDRVHKLPETKSKKTTSASVVAGTCNGMGDHPVWSRATAMPVMAVYCQPVASSRLGATTSTSSEQGEYFSSSVHDLSPVVYNNGITRFIHVPRLPFSSNAHNILQRLAREFMPIIRRRGYNVKAVSELCCCTDGVHDLLHPGENKTIKTTTASGGSEDHCDGYNETVSLSISGDKVHAIFLRIRSWSNHYRFLSYSEIVSTMAHELAHCVHGPHNAAFWKLKREIELEHQSLVASEVATHGNTYSPDDFGGFDIYGNHSAKRSGT